MTNVKITKRALLASVIAILICFTMLIGTTFAWFTDSVESVPMKRPLWKPLSVCRMPASVPWFA